MRFATIIDRLVLFGVAAEAVQRAINGIIGIMAKKRAYFCFDFDEDQGLKHHMVGQIKLPDSPFEGADWSMKEAALQQNWEAEAEARIRRSDVVVVLVGEKTHKAKEVAIARRLKKPIVQIIGYKDSNPTPVLDAGRLLRWTWPNMTSVLG